MGNDQNKSDYIVSVYRRYKDLLIEDARANDDFIYGADHIASRLTVAHTLDQLAVSSGGKDLELLRHLPPKVRKVSAKEVKARKSKIMRVLRKAYDSLRNGNRMTRYGPV